MAIQTIVSHETEEREDRRQTFKNVIQITRNKDKAYRARLPELIVTREVLYTSPREQEDEDNARMMYGTRRGRSLQGTSKREVQPQRIPGPTNGSRQDRRGWIDQTLPHEKSAASHNVVCHLCYAHGHYSPDWKLPYGRWKKVPANFEA